MGKALRDPTRSSWLLGGLLLGAAGRQLDEREPPAVDQANLQRAPGLLVDRVTPWSPADVLLTWRQPFASSVVRIAAPRLSTSSRPRYTSRAAFTVGDSMIV